MRTASTILLSQLGAPSASGDTTTRYHHEGQCILPAPLLLPYYLPPVLFSFILTPLTTTHDIQNGGDAQKSSHLRARLNTTSFRIQSPQKRVPGSKLQLSVSANVWEF